MLIRCAVEGRATPAFHHSNRQTEVVAFENPHGSAREARHLDPEFFAQFTDQGSRFCFFGLDVAAGNIPNIGIPCSITPSVREKNALLPNQKAANTYSYRHLTLVPRTRLFETFTCAYAQRGLR
jgi:hypothetical protein